MNNPGDEGARHDGPPLVSCENLTFSYPGSEGTALAGVSFKLGTGEYVGVVGPKQLLDLGAGGDAVLVGVRLAQQRLDRPRRDLFAHDLRAGRNADDPQVLGPKSEK